MNTYTQTDRRIHYLTQILAKAGRTFIPKKEDDSHTNLYFDPEKNWIETHWIESPKGKVKLVLRITDFCMLWLNEKEEVIQVFATVKEYESDVIEALKKGVEKVGLNSSGFEESMHYQIPDYSFLNQPFAMINRHLLDEWMQLRSFGNEACEKVLGILDVEGIIRIWPHHFDTGIYISATENLGIGFGLAMEDKMVDAPYFYMTGYPIEGKLTYQDLPELGFGKWEITKGYNGAILPITDIEEVKNALDEYIEKSIDWFLDNDINHLNGK